MNEERIKLYKRLPEIYRIKDEEQDPPGQLRDYLKLVEDIFGKIHFDIESLYHNLFIDTCDDWVVPYIGDLLGTGHLSGDPWTIRADVADTIVLRKLKGTLLSIERLTYDLTQWGVHCVELRENLLWHQSLNHPRPDVYHNRHVSQNEMASGPIRGGTVNMKHPAVLSLIKTAFDQFAYSPDVKQDSFGAVRYNLPNLAIFLWTLQAYQVKASKPLLTGATNVTPTLPEEASFTVRVKVYPTGEPIVLFNTNRFNFDSRQALLPINFLSEVDKTPNPIPRARLCKNSPAGNPYEYVTLNTYSSHSSSEKPSLEISRVGLQLHFPAPDFVGEDFSEWSIRGENLCAWEQGILPSLKNREIAIDPKIGRIVIGLDSLDKQESLIENLLVTYTYGSVGPVGAHPVSRSPLPTEWRMPEQSAVDFRPVDHTEPNSLMLALDNINESKKPVVIEINDNMTYTLDINQVQGTIVENGLHSIGLNKPLIIRAADNQRPIIKLVNPLRFRPTKVKGTSLEEQALTKVILEGLYITRDTSFPDSEALIARAAINSLLIKGCTLDPGGYMTLNKIRAPIRNSIDLRKRPYFSDTELEKAFTQVPLIHLERTISGPIFIDKDYLLLRLVNSIIDARSGTGSDPVHANVAISGDSTDPSHTWSPPVDVQGITVFGRMRSKKVEGISTGGIWVHSLEILDNQAGCIKFSYFSGKGDKLPMNFGCVRGDEANLLFESEVFLSPAYGQLSHLTDFRIRERGPNGDMMGAFGFLFDAHKWQNLAIRYREFVPVGLRPLIIKVT